MKNRILAIALMTIAVGVLTGTDDCENKSHKGGDKELGSCKEDFDCSLVKADCCGCNKGGKVKALAKAKEKEYIDALNAKCGGIMCMQMISRDPSCKKKAVCREGNCELN